MIVVAFFKNLCYNKNGELLVNFDDRNRRDFVKLATTTGDFDRYCDEYEDRIKNLHDAGFKCIDLSLYNLEKSKELLYDEKWEYNVKRIKEFAENLGMEFVQSHSPNFNPLGSDEEFEQAVEKNIRSIEICSMLGIPNMVIHPGWNREFTKDEFHRENKKFFERLFDAAEKFNVNVLHENTTSANMPWYFPKTGAEMVEFSEYVNHPKFHSCWDTGHGNVEGAQYEELVTMGKDLYAVHINDNRGTGDEHIIPFMGTLNMDEVMHGLADAGFSGAFTFESESAMRWSDSWQGRRHEFLKDSRVLNPSEELQQALERFMYKVGKYVLTAYNEYEG